MGPLDPCRPKSTRVEHPNFCGPQRTRVKLADSPLITLYTLFCNLILSSGRYFVQFLFGEFFCPILFGGPQSGASAASPSRGA